MKYTGNVNATKGKCFLALPLVALLVFSRPDRLLSESFSRSKTNVINYRRVKSFDWNCSLDCMKVQGGVLMCTRCKRGLVGVKWSSDSGCLSDIAL